MVNRRHLAKTAATAALVLRAGLAHADPATCIGELTPLPMEVKTSADVSFKALAERHYLYVNLMTAGRAAAQKRDWAQAIAKWDTLVHLPNVPEDIELAVTPLLNEARSRAREAGIELPRTSNAPSLPPIGPAAGAVSVTGESAHETRAVPARKRGFEVTGVVSGGGPAGPGGTVVWLRRIDGAMPAPSPVTRTIRQRNKTFSPHVLAIPRGGSVQFVNDDEIHHNVFSATKPNEFDSGLYRRGGSYSQQFRTAGPVEILCNIHATMSAYVYVVDSPYYAVAGQAGRFRITDVPPGRYRLEAWNEAASGTAAQIISVGEHSAPVLVAVAGDRGTRGPAPDKYGRPRQEHIGY